MNSHFVGAVIYADDITLLGPNRNSVMALLDMCSNNAHDHDIIFNPSKTTCIHFPCHQSSFPGKELSFMGTAILERQNGNTISKLSHRKKMI